MPTLETPRGILTETSAILDYIAVQVPQAKLVPRDAFMAAKMRETMIYLASTMHVNHAHGARGSRWADDPASWADMKQKVVQTMSDSAAYIEDKVMVGPFVMGDQFTLADPYLFVVSTWLPGDGVDMGKYPKIHALNKAMWERPSVRTALSDGIL